MKGASSGRLQGREHRRSVSSIHAVAATFALVVLSGCGSSDRSAAEDAERLAAEVPRVHVHPIGLQLSIAPGYLVMTTPVGFAIAPVNNAHLRDPINISIELLATPPESTGIRLRYLGSGRLLWYSVERIKEGGSSGWEWSVVAFEHVGEKWIKYRENKLTERQPDELWEIARGLAF